MSAQACPPCIPGKNSHTIAEASGSQSAISMGPETLSRTMSGMPNLFDSVLARSSAARSSSGIAIDSRSKNSWPLALTVTMTASVSSLTSPKVTLSLPAISATQSYTFVLSVVITSALPSPDAIISRECLPKKAIFEFSLSGSEPSFLRSVMPSQAVRYAALMHSPVSMSSGVRCPFTAGVSASTFR